MQFYENELAFCSVILFTFFIFSYFKLKTENQMACDRVNKVNIPWFSLELQTAFPAARTFETSELNGDA